MGNNGAAAVGGITAGVKSHKRGGMAASVATTTWGGKSTPNVRLQIKRVGLVLKKRCSSGEVLCPPSTITAGPKPLAAHNRRCIFRSVVRSSAQLQFHSRRVWRRQAVSICTADAPKSASAQKGRAEKKKKKPPTSRSMAPSRMQLLSPRNIGLLSRGRTQLFGGGGAQRAGGGGDGPRGRSLSSSPLSSRTLSSVSETRRGLPREKMTENGVSSKAKVLTIDTMNPTVKKVEYAVRGPIVQRAVELERELSQVWHLFVICLFLFATQFRLQPY